MLSATFLSVCAACAIFAAPAFEPPVRLKAGDKFLGHQLDGRERLYPSPVLHDLDGDGKQELLVADLFGNVTYSTRTGDGWGEEKVLKAADGKPLKFHNW